MLVRSALDPADDEAVLALWALARPDLDPAALPALLAAERRRDPELVLVAAIDDGERIVGTATGCRSSSTNRTPAAGPSGPAGPTSRIRARST